MAPKKRLHELARELDVTTDRLMDIAHRNGMRFTSNFNAVEPEQEKKLRDIVLGPIRKATKPIVKIVKTAKQKAKEAEVVEIPEEIQEEEKPAVKIVKKKAAPETVKYLEEKTVKPQAEKETKPAEKAEKAPKPAPKTKVEGKPDKVREDSTKEVKKSKPAEKKAESKPEEKKAKAEKVKKDKKQGAQKPKATEKPAKPKKPAKIDPEELAKQAERAVAERAKKAKQDAKKRAGTQEKPAAKKVEKQKPVAAKGKAHAPAAAEEKPAADDPRKSKKTKHKAHDGRFDREENKESRKKKKRKVKGQPKQSSGRDQKPVQPGKKRAKMPTAPKVDHVILSEGMTLKDLADKMGIKAKDIIQKLLLEKGIMANINHVLDMETATEIASSYGVSAEEVSYEEEIALEEELKVEGEAIERAPVITIMGHVDHGKTTLLDYIRNSSITSGEFGGITQHIGAYKVSRSGKDIVFLDTPGHAAFTRLRARGAQVTDIVILIVAADDGVMPQTIESIQHARSAEVPIIVAITKCDKPTANLDKVRKELADNNVLVEDWGGETVCVPVSSKTGEGIDDLLEMILLVSEMLDLKAYPDISGMGSVIEAKLDKAKGPVATVLIQNGSAKVGDFFIAGTTMGKVRAMFNDRGVKVENADPSTPVEILGFNGVPESGDNFQVAVDETKARQMVNYRLEQKRAEKMARGSKLSLDDLFSKISEGDIKELPLIIKGDVKGSVEALSDSLEKLSTDKVKVNIILAQPGAVSDSDVLLATASNAIIIGFNVKASRTAESIAEKEGIEIRTYNIIYEVINDVKNAMRGLLAPTYKEVIIGKAEVRQTFKVPKIGIISGCYVLDGVMKRSAKARLIRDDIVIWDGKVSSLKRFKDDVREVKTGFECGIGLDGQQDVRENDIIEMYIKEEVESQL